MSTETQESTGMATKPVSEHQWLQQLVGEWQCETEMSMGPDQPKQIAKGSETVKSVAGLWAFAEGAMAMPDGTSMDYYSTLGYDVSFKEYRGCWFASFSSHLWKQVGELSADGKVMTLDCIGPSMVTDGETANYRDVIEILDENHRTLTAYGEDGKGGWQQFMKAYFTRI